MKTAGKRSTGINGLDLILDGGYPAGTRIVIYSSPLLGIDLMAGQFWRSEREEATYLMLDGSVEEEMVDARTLGLDEIKRLMTGERIVVDSLSTLILKYGIDDTITSIMREVSEVLRSGSNILYLMYQGLHSPADEIRIMREADIFIVLSEVLHGNEFERTLSIRKIRGRDVPQRAVPFHIAATGLELSTTSRVV